MNSTECSHRRTALGAFWGKMLSWHTLEQKILGKLKGTVLGAFTYIFPLSPQTGELTSPRYWFTVSPWQSPLWGLVLSRESCLARHYILSCCRHPVSVDSSTGINLYWILPPSPVQDNSVGSSQFIAPVGLAETSLASASQTKFSFLDLLPSLPTFPPFPSLL